MGTANRVGGRADDELARAVREQTSVTVSSALPERICYSRDLWPRHHLSVRLGQIAEHQPAAIAWPQSVQQVSELIAVCRREGAQLVPFGAGSGVCGGILPDKRTIIVDLKRMNRCRSLNPEEGYVEVEAGALGIRLEEDLNARGQTVGHFPSSILCSTVGGWIAGRGAGQCSGRYGKIEDMTAAIECVDGRGQVALLHRRTSGPDLTPLIVGSEGILAVVTAARLRLHAVPERRAYAAFRFKTMAEGWEAIRRIYQAGLRPAVCRLYDPFDAMMARRSERKSPTDSGASKHHRASGSALSRQLRDGLLRGILRRPTLLNGLIDSFHGKHLGGAMLVLVSEGQGEQPAAEMSMASSFAAELGGKALGEGPARHWERHRYSVSYRQAPMFMAGAFVDTMEVAAPWALLGQLYEGVRQAISKRVMVMAHMSHAYPDGCSIYFTFAGCPKTPDAGLALYDETWRCGLEAALDAGGTISHHHGVGRSKAAFLHRELGDGLKVLGALKQAFDPDGILNAGNLVCKPPASGQPLPPSPPTPELDPISQTLHVAGHHTLGQARQVAAAHGLSLAAAEPWHEATIDRWLAHGAPGACDRYDDPVDQLLSGFSAQLVGGGTLNIQPSPRRAAGPDLWALFLGTRGRVGKIHSLHLRVRGAEARVLACPIARNPAPSSVENSWIERTLEAASSVG